MPFPGHALTLDALKAEVERVTGRSLRATRFPWWLITVASPVWELARELKEMRYLWQVSHSLSPDRLTHLLPEFEPTPLREVIRAALPQDTARPATAQALA